MTDPAQHVVNDQDFPGTKLQKLTDLFLSWT